MIVILLHKYGKFTTNHFKNTTKLRYNHLKIKKEFSPHWHQIDHLPTFPPVLCLFVVLERLLYLRVTVIATHVYNNFVFEFHFKFSIS